MRAPVNAAQSPARQARCCSPIPAASVVSLVRRQPVTEQRFCQPTCSPLGFVDTRLVLDLADEPLNPRAQVVHVIVVTLDPVSGTDWAPAQSVCLLASGSQIVQTDGQEPG